MDGFFARFYIELPSMPSNIEQPQDDLDLSTETPQTTTGLAADIQHETKCAINRTYICGRLTKWTEEHFGKLGLIEFIKRSDLMEILKTAIKTTPDDCFREQKPVPRKTPLQTRSFFQPVMTKAFDLCSAEALEQCRNLNLSTSLKLLVCAMEFARIAGLEVSPALISCFEEIRKKLTKGSELEKLSIQAQLLFPSLALRPAMQQQPEFAATSHTVPKFYEDVTETDLPHLTVNDLIIFSMQAQGARNDYDHESAIMFLKERLRRDPASRSALMNLQHSYKQLGRYREALEILEKLRNHRSIRGNPEKEGMIDEKIADMRSHIEAEETGQQQRTNVKLEKPVQKIFWRDFLNNLYSKVETWPAAEGGGHGWHAVPADEQDALEKTLILCRRTLQHNRMLPTGTPPEKNLNNTIKDVRRGCINTHVLDRLVVSAGGMAGRVVIELSNVL